MARNEVFRDADHISLPVPDGTAAGVAVISGSLIGVTETAEGEGGNAALSATVFRKGCHDLPVTGAITTIGQPVYIPPAGGAVTATATNNTLFGYAYELKSSGTATIRVILARV